MYVAIGRVSLLVGRCVCVQRTWGGGGEGLGTKLAMWVQYSRNALGLMSLDLSELLARFDGTFLWLAHRPY